jgi:hypothetical protein
MMSNLHKCAKNVVLDTLLSCRDLVRFVLCFIFLCLVHHCVRRLRIGGEYYVLRLLSFYLNVSSMLLNLRSCWTDLNKTGTHVQVTSRTTVFENGHRTPTAQYWRAKVLKKNRYFDLPTSGCLLIIFNRLHHVKNKAALTAANFFNYVWNNLDASHLSGNQDRMRNISILKII